MHRVLGHRAPSLLLAGTVPLVAIQINALAVDGKIVLDFVRVLDQRLLRRDDVADSKLQLAPTSAQLHSVT